MKVSESWLREWVNPSVTITELAQQLSMAGLEVDDIAPVAHPFNHVVIGQVVEVQPHPDAERLKIATVEVGQDTPLNIVCGATNVAVDIKVPTALVGAKLPNGMVIKKSKLRGVESEGMLCGASELDMLDDVDGLMILEADAPIGEDIRAYLNLDDQILDISITPNRGDCFSVYGIAREVAALTSTKLTPLSALLMTSEEAQNEDDTDKDAGLTAARMRVTLDTPDCPRYLAQFISMTNAADTPAAIKQALHSMGVTSHSLMVDITNYVMLLTGQPLHAFDADKIQGDIHVRYAQPEESITLLNEQTVTLAPDVLVIADDAGVVAIAGIMGGLKTAVTDETTSVLLESAFFRPHAVANRARRYGLHTDASQRFERGVDPELPALALDIAIQLLKSADSAVKIGKRIITEQAEALPDRPTVTMTASEVTARLGVELNPDFIQSSLTRLGIAVTSSDSATDNSKDNDATFNCTPPTHRFDIAIKEDLIEEVARMYGYDNIPVVLPKLATNLNPINHSQQRLNRIKQQLCVRGYYEAISFSFSDAKIDALFADSDNGNPSDASTAQLALQNPISADLAVMRRTLLSSLLPCLQYNLNRQQQQIKLFETGLRFVGADVASVEQIETLGMVAVGYTADELWHGRAALDFYDIKQDIELILSSGLDESILDKVEYQRSQQAFLHPGQSADIVVDGEVVGWFGQLHPSVADTLDLPTTWVAQLDIAVLNQYQQPVIDTPSKFPSVRRDLAIVVSETVDAGLIEKCIREAAGDYLTDIWLFDVYQGDAIGEKNKSLAFALLWQDIDKTLAEDNINKITDNIISSLKTSYQATLRGE